MWLTLIRPGFMSVVDPGCLAWGTPAAFVAWVSWQWKQLGNDASPCVNDSMAKLDIRSSPPVMELTLSEPFRTTSGSVMSLTSDRFTVNVPGVPSTNDIPTGTSCQMAPTSLYQGRLSMASGLGVVTLKRVV